MMKRNMVIIITGFIVGNLMNPNWVLASSKYDDSSQYEITITNLTRGQIFSPILVATHKQNVPLFELGAPASPGLAALAQDGETEGLANMLLSMPAVGNVVVSSGGPVLPGTTVTIEIPAVRYFNYISLAAMLVTTNDGFIALNGIRAPRSRYLKTYLSPAYDAGSEANDEMCDYIPGPPCGSHHQASAIAGEGFIHIHAGIQGVGDLAPAEFDWRNPVAKITIRKKR
jgi:hypothetical protein